MTTTESGTVFRCPKCGSPADAGDVYCGDCGERLGGPSQPNLPRATSPELSAPVPVSSEPSPTRRRNVLAAVLIMVVLAIVVGAGLTLRSNERLRGWATRLWPTNGAQVLGPIVEMPPAIVFRGASDGLASSSGRLPLPQDLAAAEQAASQRPNDARAQNDAAALLGESGAHVRSTELFEAAQRLAPNDATIAFNYGRELYRQGRVDEAVAQVDRALQVKPEFDEARLLRAEAAIGRKDYDGAQRDLDKIVKQIEVATLIARGVVLLAKGKTRDGMQSFQQALQIAGASENAALQYNLGVGSQRLGEYQQADRYYRSAIRANPNLAEAHNNLGTLLARAGDVQTAFESFHAASLLKPADIHIAGNLSRSTLQGGQVKDLIVGDWQVQAGTLEISGVVNGEAGSQSVPMPTGSRITIYSVTDNSYRWDEMAAGMNISTTIQRQPNGSYTGPAVMPPEIARMIPPGVSDVGVVTFWARGNTLFGDTTEAVTGPNVKLNVRRSWRATRTR